MPLTLEDIAEQAGVSRSTVSRVINGDKNVSDKTREHVMQILQETNFQPNMAARGLAVGRSRVIGLVIPTGVANIFSDPFFPLLIQSITTVTNSLDYSTMLWLAEPEFERRTIRQILYSGLTDGVIVSSYEMDDPIIKAIYESELPFVLVGRNPSNQNITYVDTDNINGAYQATTHLIQLGRQRVGSITGPIKSQAGIDRLKGYKLALRNRNIEVDENLIAEGFNSETSGYEAMKKILLYAPDAVFVASDTMAYGAIRAILEKNLRIPDDIAIVGFDDIPSAAHSLPPLTTIRQPIHQMGATAAEILIDIITHPNSEPRRIILPNELIIRKSCGAITS